MTLKTVDEKDETASCGEEKLKKGPPGILNSRRSFLCGALTGMIILSAVAALFWGFGSAFFIHLDLRQNKG